jgi:Sulfotransferase family
MEVLYILGCHRSGSTILTILLGNHSDIFGAGELGGYCKSSGLPKRSNNRLLNFWKSVKNEMENNLNGKLFIKKYDPSELESNSYFIKHILGKNKKDELNSYYQYIEQLYLSISKVSNRQIIIDSSKIISKAYILYKLFKANNNVKIKFIHLVRDPRGVVHSCLKSNESVLQGILFYLKTNFWAEIFKTIVPSSKFITVRYEDLLFSRKHILEHLTQFVGVSLDEISRKIENSGYFDTGLLFNGNRIKGKDNIRLSNKVEWISTLSKAKIVLIYLFCLPFCLKYRYKVFP